MSLSKFIRLIPVRSSYYPSICGCRSFSSKIPAQKIVKEIDPNTGELKTKKTNIIPKITLLSGDQIQISTLPEAEKLAKRRDLKLVKIVDIDTKTQRPVYRLMTGSEYHAEDLKQRELKKKTNKQTVKGEKVLLINSRISQHDLETQMKKAVKWIQKLYEVRVIINASGGNLETAEKIYSTIEQHFKNEESEAKITPKTVKGSDIKFQILPQPNSPKTQNNNNNNL